MKQDGPYIAVVSWGLRKKRNSTRLLNEQGVLTL